MHYFAGIFDAKGYVSLCPNGAFTIAIEMSNEEIPNLFKNNFKGSIYKRKRDKRKECWIWKINSISEQAFHFINSIEPFSILKRNQLITLRHYLDQPRKSRKLTRHFACSTIRNFKNPSPLTINHNLPRIEKPIEPNFFEWFAGFIDGDGNFVCNEYIDNRNNKKYFSHQISASNIFLEAICHINDRIPGCITTLKGSFHPVFKWTCKRKAEEFVCKNIIPFMIVKKSQCELFMEFIKFPEKTRNIPHSTEDRDRMYAITNQIKHLNSL